MTRFINSILASKAPRRQEHHFDFSRTNSSFPSVKFQGNELGFLLACVSQSVVVAAGKPFHIAGLEVSRQRRLALDEAENIKVGNRYQ
jgi:hypothetical protein